MEVSIVDLRTACAAADDHGEELGTTRMCGRGQACVRRARPKGSLTGERLIEVLGHRMREG